MRNRVLDDVSAGTLAEALLEVIDDLGFPAQEAIPGLIATVNALAKTLPRPDQALDEAAEMLADGL